MATLPSTCTLASAAAAGVEIQAWFGRHDLQNALRRWRELSGKGISVGLWEVEQLVEVPRGGPMAATDIEQALGVVAHRGGKFWVVGLTQPDRSGLGYVRQVLVPEEA